MKKTLSLILTVILTVFCLASCGGNEANSAYDLYNNAMKAYENGIDVKTTITMDILGEKVETEMSMKGGKDSCEINMTVEGMEVAAIYVDGVMYMDMDLGELGKQKLKQEISLEEFMEEAGAGESDLPELTEEVLKDIPVETKDGKKSFTVTLDGKEYSELLESFAGEMAIGAEYGEIKMTCTFKNDGTLSELLMSTSLTMDGESAGMEIKMEFNSIGKAPSISAPADADSYTDMGGLLG